MKEEHPQVKLVSPAKGLDRQLDVANERGFLSHALVEIGGTDFYPVCFYTCEEVSGELLEDPKYPFKFLAEIGMIVLPEITLDRMEKAVQRLYEQGYFRYMRPLTQEELLNAKTCLDWPP